MNAIKINYQLEKFNEENVCTLINSLGLNCSNYFLAMTKPSLLTVAALGAASEFTSRYCLFCFNETKINLVLLSRLDTKKATDIIEIPKEEITKLKLSNVLVSYMLKVGTNNSELNFQVFKKVAHFPSVHTGINNFKIMYNL